MIEKVINIFKEQIGDQIDIKPESLLIEDLCLSSLDIMNVIVTFEDEYEIEVPDKIIRNFRTIQDIAIYIESHV